MFRGSSSHTIDPKGRIIIPSRFREVLKQDGDGVMISRLDNCVMAYPFEEWSKLESRILAMAKSSDKMRRFKRVFIGSACECFCDKQGRILIPPPLRQYANLEKDIVLVGVLEHFEIYSREQWEKENHILEDDLKDINEEEFRNEIADLGF